MKKESMYNLGRILLFVAAGLLTLTIVLYAASAIMIGQLEDAMEYDSYLNFNLNGKNLKFLIKMMRQTLTSNSYYNTYNYGVVDFIEEALDVDVPAGAAFGIISLYARGWFMFVTLSCLIASLVLMIIAKEPEFLPSAGKFFASFGRGFVKSFKNLFTSSSPKAPKAPKVRYNCPNCGAPVNGKVPFCSQCGAKLPDMATVGVCSACGTKNAPNANFCAGCGAPIK